MKPTTLSKLCSSLRKTQLPIHTPILVSDYLKGKKQQNLFPVYSILNDFSCLLHIYTKEGLEYSKSYEQSFVLKHSVPSTGVFHKHGYIELLYVVEGSFEQILLGQTLCFKQGEFVITDQNCEHADLFAERDATVLFLQLNPNYLDLLLHQYDQQNELQQFLFHSLRIQKQEQRFLGLTAKNNHVHSLMEELLARLFQENMARHIGYSDIQKGLLLRLFHLLCSEYVPQIHSNSKEEKEKSILYEIERYIHMYPADSTTANLEKEFHYHRNFYNLLIKKYHGKTFRQYVTEIRMNYASQLLTQTTLTIKEIASLVGYENTSFFYHQFELTFSCSPFTYRKNR